MSAILVKPLAFTSVLETSAVLNPASNLNLDIPLLVWRSTAHGASSKYIRIDLGSAKTFDTISLVGHNLSATSTIQIATGNNSDLTYFNGSYAATNAAWSGSKPDDKKAISIFKIPSQTHRYIFISFPFASVDTGSDTYIEVQRLVVGKAVETTGIDVNAEQSFEDQSIFFDGAGYASVDEYEVLPTWKATLSWITDEQWRTKIFPFILSVGRKKAVLFVPKMEFPDRWQSEAMFGRLTSVAKGQHNSSDNWVFEFVMRALAP